MEKTMSDVNFQKIMEASPSGLESNSAAFYFGGLGQMNGLLCPFPLLHTESDGASCIVELP